MNTHESFFRSAFRLLFVCLVLLLSFWVGYGAAWALDRARQYGSFHPELDGGFLPSAGEAGEPHPGNDGGGYLPASGPSGDSWGLSFPSPGSPPVGNATAEELREYNAYYTAPTEEKVIYLTFDAGYENGSTPAILDALKKHNAPAAFFLVGNYLETSPDLVKRMISEGHIVGNHTFHHPDMAKIASREAFEKELGDLEALCQEVTGQPMKKYYRPPQGRYSESNLQMARDMGYTTFFWSLAYVDWYEDRQPSKEEAFEKLLGRIHPGAIVLLHSTSKTNGEILDELLTRWEEMGYRFGSLDEFA